HVVHGMRNIEEMFEELACNILIAGIFVSQLDCNGQKVQAVSRHPTRAVGLFHMATGGEGAASIENSDVIQPQEPTLKNVLSYGVFAVYPPGEVKKEFLKY